MWISAIMIVLVSTFLIAWLLVSCNTTQSGDTIVENKNVKSVYLGKIAGIWGYAYKITVDSVDYIVIKTGDGVAITRHSK